MYRYGKLGAKACLCWNIQIAQCTGLIIEFRNRLDEAMRKGENYEVTKKSRSADSFDNLYSGGALSGGPSDKSRSCRVQESCPILGRE